jgi:hypothetical protein
MLMSGTEDKKNHKLHMAVRLMSWLSVSVLCLLLLIAFGSRIYLASSLPAPKLSSYLSSYLHQSFTVESMQIAGGGLVLKGVRLKNPAGFSQGNLAAADSVTVAPQWGSLLSGSQRFRLIALDGVAVNLEKNGSGVWNYAQLQQLLAARKPSAGETYIKELNVKNGALKIQGEGAQGISLQVFNLTTKGSLDSAVDLAFEDAAHNRYALKGKARAGRDAALDLALTASLPSLKDTAAMLKLKNPALFAGGQGALSMNASLHKGELSTSGEFTFSGLRLPSAAKADPLTGSLHVAADYSFRSDRARLKSSSLNIEHLVTLHAEGSAQGLKGERDFVLQIGTDELDLAALNGLVPDAARRHLLIGGRLRCDSLSLEGNRAQGLRTAVGTLHLRDGALAREGRSLVTGLSGDLGFARKAGAVVAKGKLSLSGPHDKQLLTALDLPFDLKLSAQLKPVSAAVPSFSARVAAVPITGRLAYVAGKTDPITAFLQVPEAKLSTLNALIGRLALHADSGSASARIEVTGKSVQELSGTAAVQLWDVRGSRGKDTFAVQKGAVLARIRRSAGHLQAQGEAQLSSASINGEPADARFAYRVTDGMVHLDELQASARGMKFAVSHLAASMPVRQSAAGVSRYPIALDLEGCTLKRGELEVRNLAGHLKGNFNSASTGRWLDASADLTASAVNWQGKAVGAPAAHAGFSRSGIKAELGGQLLGGRLAGNVSFNPAAPVAGETFDLAVSGAGLPAAARFLPARTGVLPSGGVLDLSLNGGYSGRNGLACRFRSTGSGIVLTGAGAKTLVSGAGLSLVGTLAGGNLKIAEAVLSPAKGVALNLTGELLQAFSAKRQGSLTFSLPQTPLKELVDSFLNLMPRFIQEATVNGTVAASGKMDLHADKKLLEGAFTFKDGRMEVPSQKMVLSGITGRVPFSLDLSGKAPVRPPVKQPASMDFSRENFPRLLEQLRRNADGGELFTVGKITFGALELGKLTMQVRAGNGITDISSLQSSFYEGALLGRGIFALGQHPDYRGDLLIQGISMKALCSKIPNVKGYISGRVDGVISVSGGAGGLAGITGFTHLWAREGAGEKMLVSKEFLQRLSKQKLSGFFLSSDRPYDQAEIKAMLMGGDMSFDTLQIVHTNLFGVRDLNVSVAPAQNRIALDHLFASIKEAAVRGKPTAGGKPTSSPAEAPAEAGPAQEFKWGE